MFGAGGRIPSATANTVFATLKPTLSWLRFASCGLYWQDGISSAAMAGLTVIVTEEKLVNAAAFVEFWLTDTMLWPSHVQSAPDMGPEVATGSLKAISIREASVWLGPPVC